MNFITAILATCSLFLVSCATIVSNQERTTKIETVPSQMSYVIRDKGGNVVSQGTTPSTVKLNRSPGYFQRGTYTIDVKKRNKVVATETIEASVNGWFWGNIAFGGAIGMFVVDPLTGAMFRMPESVMIDTTKTTPVTAGNRQSQTFQIVDISTLTTAQRSKLVRI